MFPKRKVKKSNRARQANLHLPAITEHDWSRSRNKSFVPLTVTSFAQESKISRLPSIGRVERRQSNHTTAATSLTLPLDDYSPSVKVIPGLKSVFSPQVEVTVKTGNQWLEEAAPHDLNQTSSNTSKDSYWQIYVSERSKLDKYLVLELKNNPVFRFLDIEASEEAPEELIDPMSVVDRFVSKDGNEYLDVESSLRMNNTMFRDLYDTSLESYAKAILSKIETKKLSCYARHIKYWEPLSSPNAMAGRVFTVINYGPGL